MEIKMSSKGSILFISHKLKAALEQSNSLQEFLDLFKDWQYVSTQEQQKVDEFLCGNKTVCKALGLNEDGAEDEDNAWTIDENVIIYSKEIIADTFFEIPRESEYAQFEVM